MNRIALFSRSSAAAAPVSKTTHWKFPLMENQEEDQITEEQRRRAEANRAAALAKRKAILSLGENGNLFKCRKLSSDAKHPLTHGSTGPGPRPEKFRARLEICSPDSFSVTPVAIEGFEFPGEDVCFEKLRDCFLNVCIFLSFVLLWLGYGTLGLFLSLDFYIFELMALCLVNMISWTSIRIGPLVLPNLVGDSVLFFYGMAGFIALFTMFVSRFAYFKGSVLQDVLCECSGLRTWVDILMFVYLLESLHFSWKRR